MLKQTLIITSAVFSTTLLLAGVSVAQQEVVCNPHCAPTKSNKGGDVTGLQRAQSSAGEHGMQGRCNAATRQGVTLSGCGGDPPPPVIPPPVVPPPVIPPPVVPPPSDPPPVPGPTPPPTGGLPGLPGGCTLC